MAKLLERLFVGKRSYQMGGGAHPDDPLKQGLAFQVDYVGYEDMHQEPKEVFSESEKVIDSQLKTVPPPYRRLSLIISDTHLVVLQSKSGSQGSRGQLVVISNIPIYRVFYCGSHTTRTNSISIVAYSRQSKGLKCLVLLCASTKKAQTLVNVVAKAFQNSYMRWLEESKELKKAKRAAAKAAAKASLDDGSEAKGNDIEPENAPESEAENAPEPEAIAAEPVAPVSARDQVLLDLGNLDISDSANLESERKEMYKTFSKRSKMERPDILDTGNLQVQPAEVDLTEAAKMVDSVEDVGEPKSP